MDASNQHVSQVCATDANIDGGYMYIGHRADKGLDRCS